MKGQMKMDKAMTERLTDEEVRKQFETWWRTFAFNPESGRFDVCNANNGASYEACLGLFREVVESNERLKELRKAQRWVSVKESAGDTDIGSCGICGGKMAMIRGKHPKEEGRRVCPTCDHERLELINEMSRRDYGQAYTDMPLKTLKLSSSSPPERNEQ